MVKVVKLYLSPTFRHRDDTDIEYKDVCIILRELQREVREIKNKTVTDCWEWKGFSADYKKQHDEYPQPIDFLKSKKGKEVKTLETYIYGKHADDGYRLCKRSYGEVIRSTVSKFNNDFVDVLKGERSMISFKSNQPIPITKQQIAIMYNEEEKNFYAAMTLFSVEGAKEVNLRTSCEFRIIIKDKSTRTILERICDEIYGIAGSNLFYDEKKKMFRLNLSFENKNSKEWIDSDKVLGVKMSIKNPVTAIATGKTKPFIIEGGEIEEYRKRLESRKRSMSHQRAVCADGSRGHGYKTRMKAVNVVGDKVSMFRDTYNHKVSRAVVDYAERMGCGKIQIEDLTGITTENPFLQNWSYYDLQTKIKYKAKEKGIKVVTISRSHLNERCCKCGCISKSNITEENSFKCSNSECGFESSLDYNSALNLAIIDIDKVIAKETKKSEKDENN